jgi:hypothetical protein
MSEMLPGPNPPYISFINDIGDMARSARLLEPRLVLETGEVGCVLSAYWKDYVGNVAEVVGWAQVEPVRVCWEGVGRMV